MRLYIEVVKVIAGTVVNEEYHADKVRPVQMFDGGRTKVVLTNGVRVSDGRRVSRFIVRQCDELTIGPVEEGE